MNCCQNGNNLVDYGNWGIAFEVVAAKEVGSYSSVLNSASSEDIGTTVLGHALSKHADRNPSIGGKLTGNPSTWHNQALKHFDDIMNAPGSFNKTINQQGINFLEERLPDGRGQEANNEQTSLAQFTHSSVNEVKISTYMIR